MTQLTVYDELERNTLAAGCMVWPMAGGKWGWIAHAGAGDREQSARGVVDASVGAQNEASTIAHQAERELLVAVYGPHPDGICPRCLREHGDVCPRPAIVAN